MSIIWIRHILLSMVCAASLAHMHEARALGLLQAYEEALVNDPIYRVALSEKAAGQQFKALGRSHLLPNVSANISANKNIADVTTATLFGDNQDRRNYTSQAASIQVRQPLFHPEGTARYLQGVAQTRVSEAQFLIRSQELIVRLVGLYAPAKYAEDQLAQAIAQRDAYSELRASSERLLLKGEGTKTEVLEAQAKYDLAEAQILEARDNLFNARNALSAMVGQDITGLDNLSDDFQIKSAESVHMDVWKELALDNNPEILAQRYIAEVASKEIAKARAGHAPRLDLVGNLSKNKSDTTNTFNQSTNLRSIGLQLNVPIYAGGSVDASVSQAIANHAKAQSDLDAKISQVLVELRKQYGLVQSSALRIAAAEKALSSARLLVDATQKSVKGGIRTNLDVLNAQQQVFEAKRELALSRYNYLLSYIRLRYSAGTLEIVDLQHIAAYFVADK
jgi:outer membrane protein, protease secretion system